jgi:hypothetical protein
VTAIVAHELGNVLARQTTQGQPATLAGDAPEHLGDGRQA